MKIVKLITTKKRVLYAIQVKPKSFFSRAKYLALTDSGNSYSAEKHIFDYCLSDNLDRVEKLLKLATEKKETILKVIERKCKCKNS